MIIVANTHMLNIFKKISLFKINLGLGLIDVKSEKIHLKDPFMLKYFNMTGKQILTYGSIGTLSFYQDFTLPVREFYIFNDDTIYGLQYTNEDSKNNPEDYLVSIIQEINEKEGIKENKEQILPEKKNPNMKLPTEQYIAEMIKKRKLDDVK